MATWDGNDFDDVLKDVAKEIRTDSEVDDLGKALGLSIPDIRSYQIMNEHGKGYDGSLKMLRDWNKTQPSSTVRETLRRALEKIGRIDLRERHFPTEGSRRAGVGLKDFKTNEDAEEVTDIHILKLSKLLGVGNYRPLCVAMGIDLNRADIILAENMNKYSDAYIAAITEWKNKSTRTLKDLDEVLKVAEAGGVISKYKK